MACNIQLPSDSGDHVPDIFFFPQNMSQIHFPSHWIKNSSLTYTKTECFYKFQLSEDRKPTENKASDAGMREWRTKTSQLHCII